MFSKNTFKSQDFLIKECTEIIPSSKRVSICQNIWKREKALGKRTVALGSIKKARSRTAKEYLSSLWGEIKLQCARYPRSFWRTPSRMRLSTQNISNEKRQCDCSAPEKGHTVEHVDPGLGIGWRNIQIAFGPCVALSLSLNWLSKNWTNFETPITIKTSPVRCSGTRLATKKRLLASPCSPPLTKCPPKLLETVKWSSQICLLPKWQSLSFLVTEEYEKLQWTVPVTWPNNILI